jgi:hypothetical protein
MQTLISFVIISLSSTIEIAQIEQPPDSKPFSAGVTAEVILRL